MLINQPTTNNIATLTNKLSAEEVKKAYRFNSIDKIPLFTACKGTKGNKSLDCFNTEMVKHIQKHFSYPYEAAINKIDIEEEVEDFFNFDDEL